MNGRALDLMTPAAMALCAQYSDDPEFFAALMGSLKVEATCWGPAPSTFEGRGPLLSLECTVTIRRDGRKVEFTFHGSHVDALAWMGLNGAQQPLPAHKARDARAQLGRRLLYSILSCVRSDYDLVDYSPDDFGYNDDSIKDMAQWAKACAHCRALRACLRLTHKELESLPS